MANLSFPISLVLSSSTLSTITDYSSHTSITKYFLSVKFKRVYKFIVLIVLELNTNRKILVD